LKACLDFFSIDSMDSFMNRFRVQKLVYLVQRLGLNLGYVYNLYRRGPYSSSLAAAAYSVLDDGSPFLAETLRSEEIGILKKAKDFERGFDDKDLEAITTLDYLSVYGYVDEPKPDVEKRLHGLKEWTIGIPRKRMDEYWTRLEDFGLLKSHSC